MVAKLLYFCQVRGQEAIAAGVPQPDDPLVIVDARLRSPPSTLTDRSRPEGSEISSAEHVWILTHPGDNPTPTPSDEDAFTVLRGSNPWAVLCVLTPAGRHAARLEFHIGPGGRLRLPVCVDLSRPFAAADHAAWDREFAVFPGPIRPQPGRRRLSPRLAASAGDPRGSRAAGRSGE